MNVDQLRPGAPQSVGLNPGAIADAMTAIVANERDSPDRPRAYPSAVAVLGYRGRIVAEEASGFARLYQAPRDPAATEAVLLPAPARIPARTDTIYDLASLSKLFTSIAAVQLVEQGRLDLDAPVQRYLPAFTGPGKERVTVSMLLTHTSGFPAWVPLYSKYPDPQSRMLGALQTPLTFLPGTDYRYSDLNMITLQQVIEKITGHRLDAVVRSRITGPLRMRDTNYAPDGRRRPRIAATEWQQVPDRGMVWGSVHDENAWALDGVAGHAGVFSTAGDLSVLAQTLLNGGVYAGHRILREESVRLLVTDRNGAFPGHAHGLGLELDQPAYMGAATGPATAGHTGFTGTSIVIDFVRGSFAILLTNRVHPSRNGRSLQPIRAAFAGALATAIDAGTDPPGGSARPAVAPPAGTGRA
ncbi:serine hydrolase [Nakamurella sp. DB0629]|uniref:Serine hydrolase n=2 Tax=Nakamurella aerolata TaxID=1656892 RepID=A0A849AB52_9ACTN|nr:serine hydrolase [Nakamurella aerolata]